jgi:hypothetical protein
MAQNINTLEELREHASKPDGADIFLLLNFGLRSSKRIHHDNGEWWIINMIDGSEQDGLTDNQLKSETLITQAIDLGSCYLD